MRTIGRIKWLNAILMAGACIALIAGMLLVFAGAVLQESFKITPPTAAELAEDPSLAVYLQESGK